MRTNAVLFLLALLLLSCGTLVAQERTCDDGNCQISAPQNAESGDAEVPEAAAKPLDENGGNPAPENVETPDLNQDQRLSRNGHKATGAEASSSALKCPGPRCPKLVPEPKTEFQKFIFTTTGAQLPIYGRNLFESPPSTFAPISHVPVPADYVVGPGDEMIIRIWGQIEFNTRAVVDRNGQVFLPRVGTLNVSGIRYDHLTEYMKGAVARVFKNFDLNVTLGQLRSIDIILVGQARRPGTYTVSSLSTLVSALFASGGPNVHGSLRHVQLKRQGRVVTEFDLYDLLGSGDKSKDVALLPGDVIYIPPVGKQVAVIGSVNLPGIYEIDDTTSVREQIAAAGGLSTTADGTHLIIERINGRATRSVQELLLDENGTAQLLRDGDIVHIFPISPRIDSSVILRGSIAAPGRYPWHSGMRVADLIPSRETLLTRQYWMRQSVLSRTPSGWRAPDTVSEEVSGASGKEKDKTAVWSDGFISNEKTQVALNPTEINWDYAVIQRLNRDDLSSGLITFNLGKALADPSSGDNMVLESGDVITIFSQNDLEVPEQKRTKWVWIEGEVSAPGVYRAGPGETLRDLVQRAGGLTPSAYLFASEFRRVSTKERQQKEKEQLIASAEKDLRTRARLSTASLNAEDKAAGQQELQYERGEIERLRGIEVTGRVVLDLKPDDAQVSALPALPLENGDQFLIPSKPATVGVVGAVYNQNSFLFDQRNTVAKYLAFAGGGTRDADTGRLFIVRANGSVLGKQMHRSIWAGSFENNRLYPGDAIVMPEKVKTTSLLTGIRDWSQVFAQFALGAAAIKVIGE